MRTESVKEATDTIEQLYHKYKGSFDKDDQTMAAMALIVSSIAVSLADIRDCMIRREAEELKAAAEKRKTAEWDFSGARD